MLNGESVLVRSMLLIAVLGVGHSALAQRAIQVSTVPTEDTAAAYVDSNWQPPRSSWGDPSFEGVWTTDDMQSVPRDRPEAFGTREKLTPEEFAERAAADVDPMGPSPEP